MTDNQQDKPKLLRDTDDEARRLARELVRGARHMALAVIDPDTGFPAASRALTGTDLDGVPVILVSGLSAHTKALSQDARCSLLAGEPGKGDPLAHARISVQCLAEPVVRDTDDHARIRQRFLDRHRKAALYVDFPDFRFFRLIPQSASLNGGFGRAYSLPGADLVIRESRPVSKWHDVQEWHELQEQMKNMPDKAAALAKRLGTSNGKNWHFAGVDPAGIDLIGGDFQLRHEFVRLIDLPSMVLDYISNIAKLE